MYTVEELKRDLENIPDDWVVEVSYDGSVLYVAPSDYSDEIILANM